MHMYALGWLTFILSEKSASESGVKLIEYEQDIPGATIPSGLGNWTEEKIIIKDKFNCYKLIKAIKFAG